MVYWSRHFHIPQGAFPVLEPSSLRGIPGCHSPPPARVGNVSGLPSAGRCFARSGRLLPSHDLTGRKKRRRCRRNGHRRLDAPRKGVRPAVHGSITSVTAHASRLMQARAVRAQVMLPWVSPGGCPPARCRRCCSGARGGPARRPAAPGAAGRGAGGGTRTGPGGPRPRNPPPPPASRPGRG
ncbi:translation initiation factor IF-2-like [Aquila chrysaetos chrysaetos]|uniref:translation initiation factor IF-2-like n=1 Tax=Aquila chrysaetos chrysaetos TaxID=223781 RepID=UPI001B7D3D89|nr:translation initiation factor IF-2-like [Aquila chrysaetos chrysaetos]